MAAAQVTGRRLRLLQNRERRWIALHDLDGELIDTELHVSYGTENLLLCSQESATGRYTDPVSTLTTYSDPVNTLTPYSDPVSTLTPYFDPVNTLTPYSDPVSTLTPYSDPASILTPYSDPATDLKIQIF